MGYHTELLANRLVKYLLLNDQNWLFINRPETEGFSKNILYFIHIKHPIYIHIDLYFLCTSLLSIVNTCKRSLRERVSVNLLENLEQRPANETVSTKLQFPSLLASQNLRAAQRKAEIRRRKKQKAFLILPCS